MLTLDVEKTGDVTIVRCHGRIVRGEEVFCLRDAVVCGKNTRIVVLDLSEVRALDAGGLAALVSLHEWAKEAGVQLKLVNPSQFVMEVLPHTSRPRVRDFLLPRCADGSQRDGVRALAVRSRAVSTTHHRGRREHRGSQTLTWGTRVLCGDETCGRSALSFSRNHPEKLTNAPER